MLLIKLSALILTMQVCFPNPMARLKEKHPNTYIKPNHVFLYEKDIFFLSLKKCHIHAKSIKYSDEKGGSI